MPFWRLPFWALPKTLGRSSYLRASGGVSHLCIHNILAQTVQCFGKAAGGALGYGDSSDRHGSPIGVADPLLSVDLGAGLRERRYTSGESVALLEGSFGPFRPKVGKTEKNRIFFCYQRARRGILMPRGKNRRETIFAAQLPRNYPHHGGIFERGKKCPLLWGRGKFGRHFKRQFGRGYLRVKNCRDTVGSQFLPRGIKMSRRALWVRKRPKMSSRVLSAPGSKKSKTESKKSQNQLFFNLFDFFSTQFSTFWASGPKGPGN